MSRVALLAPRRRRPHLERLLAELADARRDLAQEMFRELLDELAALIADERRTLPRPRRRQRAL